MSDCLASETRDKDEGISPTQEPDSANTSGNDRRNFLATSAGVAAGMLPALATAQDQPASLTNTRPRCLFFDVNETLLDLEAMKQSVAQVLNGRADLLPLWFTTMLQHSLVATVGDHYDDFGVIGAATLQMVARTVTKGSNFLMKPPDRRLPPSVLFPHIPMSSRRSSN